MPSSQDRRARTRVTPAMPMFFWVWAYTRSHDGSNGADIRSELMSAITGTRCPAAEELGTLDGVVRDEVAVPRGRPGPMMPCAGRRCGRGRPRRANVTSPCRAWLRDGFVGPVPGVHIVQPVPRGREVHRHHAELQRPAALEQQDLVPASSPRNRRARSTVSASRTSISGARWLISITLSPVPRKLNRSRSMAASTEGRGRGGRSRIEIKDTIIHDAMPEPPLL